MYKITKLPILITFFALILGLSLSTAYAQDSNQEQSQNTESHKLTLKVVDAESGEALTNAKSEILGIYEAKTANQEGQLVYQNMTTDPHTFKISADGYQTWKKTLIVTKDDSKLTVKLKPTG